MGLDSLDERICHCGSGLWREDCTNSDAEHRMQPVTEKHYGRVVLDRYMEQQKDPEPGEMVSLVLLPEGELARDPNELRKDDAAAQIAAMKARHGQAIELIMKTERPQLTRQRQPGPTRTT